MQHQTHGARIDQYRYRNRSGLGLELPRKPSFDFKVNAETYGFLFINTGLRFISKELKVSQSYWVYNDHLKSNFLQIPLSAGLKTPDFWYHPISLFASVGLYGNLAMDDASSGEFRIDAQNNVGYLYSLGVEVAINESLKVVIGYSYYEDLTPSHRLPNYNYYFGNGEFAGTNHYFFESQEVFLNVFFLLPEKTSSIDNFH